MTQAGGKRIAILQSNYIPWKGYFDIIRRVDEFVLFDEVQFTKNDWRNRNRIKTPKGLLWLTLPVRTAGRADQPINETEIADPDWARRHWQNIQASYRQAEGFAAVAPQLEALYAATAGEVLLSRVNRAFLAAICQMLGIATPLTDSREFPRREGRNERLIGICKAAGAAVYLSGPAARTYLDEPMFQAAGIAVEWMDYGGYRPYPQLHGSFEHAVSILDLLCHAGAAAGDYLIPAEPRSGAARHIA
jgi:hypothetical protein